LKGAQPSAVVHELEGVPCVAIYAVYMETEVPELRKLLRMYVTKWVDVEPITSGDDLRNMGLKPSPAYGQILDALRDAWLDGEIDNVEEEKQLLAELVSEVE
jgi:tRNA nucleotidyltransferase (CCA-adding enzyme)